MAILGNIDIVASNHVNGWAINTDDPGKPCIVVAKIKGKVVSEAEANIYRADLAAHGIGDGKHGFQLQLPPMFQTGYQADLFEKFTGLPLPGNPIKIGSEAKPSDDSAPLLLVDLSDMIFYLEHHDHLSGIQRVQANIFRATIENALVQIDRIKAVYYKEAEQQFYTMPLQFVIELLQDTQKEVPKRKIKRHSDGRLHLEAAVSVEKLALTENESKTSILLMLGAAWVYPSYFHAVRKLKRQGTRFVVLIHDLIPVIMPTMCDKGTAEVFKIFLQRTIRNADHILTVSEHTKKDLIEYCYKEGLSCPSASVAKNGQSLGEEEDIVSPPPIDGKYVLFVSTIEGRKNHILALKVWQRLVSELGANAPILVLVGRLGWRVEGFVEELYQSNLLNDKIVMLSDVPDSSLKSLYENCLFTFYPSLYEGWGLPVGESLAFGKVCLSSNASSIPEVGGDLAVYFDPTDLPAAFELAKKLVVDEDWRNLLEQNIKDSFRPITWLDTATQVINGACNALHVRSNNRLPLLTVGEYAFSRITYLESNISHGDEVARHIQKFSEPKLTYRHLKLESYILAEECLGDGIWYSPEDNWRWGHLDGNTINFLVPKDDIDYLIFLGIEIPDGFAPVLLELSHRGRKIEARNIEAHRAILRIDLAKFSVREEVSISFRIKTSARQEIPGDHRQLGVGISRLALIEKNNMDQRLEVIERTQLN